MSWEKEWLIQMYREIINDLTLTGFSVKLIQHTLLEAYFEIIAIFS